MSLSRQFKQWFNFIIWVAILAAMTARARMYQYDGWAGSKEKIVFKYKYCQICYDILVETFGHSQHCFNFFNLKKTCSNDFTLKYPQQFQWIGLFKQECINMMEERVAQKIVSKNKYWQNFN